MPSMDTVDSIEIAAPAQRIFETVLNYPETETWFPLIRCTIVDGVGENGEIGEGTRIRHTIGKPPLLIMSRFVRTIQSISPAQRIEETYDEGDLVGKGCWSFTENNGVTKVAYHCVVEANSLSMKVGFMLTGAKGHNMVYGKILRALKQLCEQGGQ